MSKATSKKNKALQDRVDFLEKINNWYAFSTDLLTQMVDIYGDTNNFRNTHTILESTRCYVQRLFNFQTVAFYLVDEQDSRFVLFECTPTERRERVQQEVDALLESGELAWVLKQNKAVTFDLPANQWLIMHVIASKTRLRGLFVGIVAKQGSAYLQEGPLSILSVLLHNSAYALESAALYHMINAQKNQLERLVEQRTEELEFQNTHDNLTSLPNRFLFLDRVGQAINRAASKSMRVIVVLLDLDMFKVINDTLGHQVGDVLLQQVAKRFLTVLREDISLTRIDNNTTITVSRIGGDEFSMLIPDVDSIEDALTVVHKMIQCLVEPIVITGQEIFVTASIGISLFPDDGLDAHTLLKHADVAMYHAKKEGRNNYQFYSHEISQKSSSYLRLTNALHQALDKNEFVLHYQPKVNLRNREVVGFEALIRWYNIHGELIPPDKFIPIAEETGLIVQIGEWAIAQSCRQLLLLQQQGFPAQKIAVNLSAKQFREANLLQNIMTTLQQYQIAPSQLELEITEGTIIQDVQLTIATLHKLHAAGFSVSIDDFGTGYSSLSYLKQFPLDCLKIDRSFLQDLPADSDDAAIVRAIVALAHSLNLTVVAEGVESVQQLQFLQSLDCQIAQGYYFSKPLPAEQMIQFLSSHR